MVAGVPSYLYHSECRLKEFHHHGAEDDVDTSLLAMEKVEQQSYDGS